MNKATIEINQIEKLMQKVFDKGQDGLLADVGKTEYDRRRNDFAFHMTDWATDLQRMAHLFEDPSVMDAEAATTFVMSFLYHVIPHLNAAGRLLLDEVGDPFSTKVQNSS